MAVERTRRSRGPAVGQRHLPPDPTTQFVGALMARHAGPADARGAGRAADLKAAWRAADDVTLVAIGRP